MSEHNNVQGDGQGAEQTAPLARRSTSVSDFYRGVGQGAPLGRPAQGALLLPTNVNPPKGVPPTEGPARKPSGGKGPLWAGLLWASLLR